MEKKFQWMILWIVVHKRCIGCRKEDMRKFLSTLTDGLESQVDPDFFQDGNDVQKKKKKQQQRNIVTQK